jgi:hypothetical protein
MPRSTRVARERPLSPEGDVECKGHDHCKPTVRHRTGEGTDRA